MAGSASTDWHRWREFVQRQRLGGTTIAGYYGAQARVGEVRSEEIVATLTGLFHDWVTTAALTLPRGRCLDDYEFVMKDKLGSWEEYNPVLFTDKQTGASTLVMRCVPTSLDGKMGGVGWKYMMRSVVDVMNGLGGASLIMDPDGNLVGIAS